jgi:hypothetical protein
MHKIAALATRQQHSFAQTSSVLDSDENLPVKQQKKKKLYSENNENRKRSTTRTHAQILI